MKCVLAVPGWHPLLLVSLCLLAAGVPGACVILIGPVDGLRHCDPEPRYVPDTWYLAPIPGNRYLTPDT